MLLGLHFLSDVVGGFLLGLAWLSGSTAVFQTWRHDVAVADAASWTAARTAPDLTAQERPRAPQLLGSSTQSGPTLGSTSAVRHRGEFHMWRDFSTFGRWVSECSIGGCAGGPSQGGRPLRRSRPGRAPRPARPCEAPRRRIPPLRRRPHPLGALRCGRGAVRGRRRPRPRSLAATTVVVRPRGRHLVVSRRGHRAWRDAAHDRAGEATEEVGAPPEPFEVLGEFVFAPASDWRYVTSVIRVPIASASPRTSRPKRSVGVPRPKSNTCLCTRASPPPGRTCGTSRSADLACSRRTRLSSLSRWRPIGPSRRRAGAWPTNRSMCEGRRSCRSRGR